MTLLTALELVDRLRSEERAVTPIVPQDVAGSPVMPAASALSTMIAPAA